MADYSLELELSDNQIKVYRKEIYDRTFSDIDQNNSSFAFEFQKFLKEEIKEQLIRTEDVYLRANDEEMNVALV